MNNLLDTIKKSIVPVHREGWPFVAGFFVIALVLLTIWQPLFWIGLGLTLWCAWFFRDPARVTRLNEDFVISPADGVVSHITKSVPPAELELGKSELERISIFMNVFNCHINRAPVKGKIVKIAYHKGSFLNAELDKASAENERNGLVIESEKGKFGVVQIAGLVARRIVCWANQGEEIAVGERFGLIRFGSRVDVYLPKGAMVNVAPGQSMIAGETIIARFDHAATLPVSRID